VEEELRGSKIAAADDKLLHVSMFATADVVEVTGGVTCASNVDMYGANRVAKFVLLATSAFSANDDVAPTCTSAVDAGVEAVEVFAAANAEPVTGRGSAAEVVITEVASSAFGTKVVIIEVESSASGSVEVTASSRAIKPTYALAWSDASGPITLV